MNALKIPVALFLWFSLSFSALPASKLPPYREHALSLNPHFYFGFDPSLSEKWVNNLAEGKAGDGYFHESHPKAHWAPGPRATETVGGKELHGFAPGNLSAKPVFVIPDEDRTFDFSKSNPDSLTLTLWVKGEPNQPEGAALLYRGGNTGASIQFALEVKEGHYLFKTCRADGALRTLKAPRSGPNGSWQHLTVVFSSTGRYAGMSGSIRMYVNGKEVAKGSTQNHGHTSIYQSHTPIYIGARPTGEDNGMTPLFKGVVDEVALWRKALKADDIKTLFERATITPEPTLIILSQAIKEPPCP